MDVDGGQFSIDIFMRHGGRVMGARGERTAYPSRDMLYVRRWWKLLTEVMGSNMLSDEAGSVAFCR